MPNKHIHILFILLVSFTISSLFLFPVEVKKKEISRFDDFQQGEFKGTSLDSKGRLFIGPKLTPLKGPSREFYLSLDLDTNGNIYIGTGHKASVYKMSSAPITPTAASGQKKSNIKEIFSSDELDIYALVAKDNGDVYAATSPEGKIYKIKNGDKDKKGSQFFNPSEKFIWDLKEDITGNLICAVGGSGGVYRIDKSGNGAKIFTPEDTHIISLYITRSNSILAGSGDRGILYRIDNRKAKVLFDSPFEEIHGICEDKDGNIYFSATRSTSSHGQRKKTHPVMESSKKEPRKKPEPLEKSILYRINTNGIVENVWTSKTEYIYAVHYDKKNDSVIIATGNSGRVYRINKDTSYAIIYESDSAQAYKIAAQKNGFALIGNNTSSIIKIQDTLNNKGTYYSEIYDLQIQSRLGRLYWEAQTPAQTNVQLFVRTGNSNVPDSTWTQWSAPFSDKENSPLNISNTRYFQIKVVLNAGGGSASPYLEQFKVYYVQSNLSPRLKKINIHKPIQSIVKTKTGYKKVKKANRLNVNWQVDDLNKDKLKFNVFIKKMNSNHWVLIKEDTTITKLEIDTQLYEDGKYLLRVVADDSLANPPAIRKKHAMTSSPFLIDSTAPVVSGFSAAGKRISFTVKDQTSIIAKVLYSFDGKLWFPVFPKDMINDSRSESYDFNLNRLQNKKIIFLKVIDEFENAKVFQEEF
jgi:hypothetical protein